MSLGSFGISCLGWIPVGPGDWDVGADEASGEPYLSVTPSLGAELMGWFALPRAFGVREPWLSLEFEVRSEQAMPLAIVLSEDTGAEWVMTTEVVAPGEWTRVSLRADGFEQSGEKPDTANGRLDTDRVVTIAILRIPNPETVMRPIGTIELRRPIVVPVPADARSEDPFT